MAVYRDGDKWRVIYRYTNYKGERKQTQKRGFATKREAVAWEHEVMLKSDSKLDIANMKQYLSSIVQGYGYKSVKEFLAEFKASKAEYADYQSAVAEWEKLTGNKAESDSMKARLQRKQQEVKERENNRQSHHYRSDRGGR